MKVEILCLNVEILYALSPIPHYTAVPGSPAKLWESVKNMSENTVLAHSRDGKKVQRLERKMPQLPYT